MQITKNSTEVRQTVLDWAEANGGTVDTQKTRGSVHVALAADKGFEFRPEDGFAYIHGEGSLNGIGTTIMDMDEFAGAVAGLVG